jgi:beta-N-acetylhexosaminidase
VEAAGRVLMVGLGGPDLEPDEEDRIVDLQPGGIILFRRNLDTPARVSRLVSRLLEIVPPPALLAVDQEGGRVSRLVDWIGDTPSAARLAALGPETAHRWGRRTGRGLRALGFNLDFAPVVDLCDADAANGIGDRSFGKDSNSVAILAGAFLEGLQAEGVAGCLKHFPGLGDTAVDSHERLPICRRDLTKLEADDLVPFARLADRAAAVMIGHAHYPALDAGESLPASLSVNVADRLLRDRIGFRGLAVSDDLEMGAVAPLDRSGRAAVLSLAAGCDLLPYCSDLGRAAAAKLALESAAAEDDRFRSRLESAARAVRRTASRWPAASPDPSRWRTACDAWREESRRALGADRA